MSMRNLVDLAGRRILVTGASSGIGRACAVMAAELGATVVLTGRRVDALRAVAAELPNSEAHAVFGCDIGNVGEIDDLVKFAAAGGKLDGLVHAAGVCPLSPLAMSGAEALESAMRVNYVAFQELMRLCPKKKFANEGFAAVAVSSVSAAVGWAGGTMYSATKGALSAAVRSMAVELAPKRIRVNAVCPSNIKTPMFDGITELNDEAAMSELERKQPLGFGAPEQVASAVCFLLSPAASFITGVNLPVDGGYLAQ